MDTLLLLKLISESYDETEANIALSFEPDERAQKDLVEKARDVLTNFPYAAGACMFMSAMLTASIRDHTKYPIHAVAGSLYIDNQPIFGKDLSSNQIKKAFKEHNLDWDGHCWIVFGNLVGDVSIFRTAYSDFAHPKLKKKVYEKFGEGRGFISATDEVLSQNGINYVPKYILTDEEITGLISGALHMINNKKL